MFFFSDTIHGLENKPRIQEESHLLTHLMANYDRKRVTAPFLCKKTQNDMNVKF
jgi:hypothetical protein